MTIINRIVLSEVEAIQPMDNPADHWPTLTTCDFCSENVCHDYSNGVEPRQFYELVGEELCVCEHCIHKIDEENPS